LGAAVFGGASARPKNFRQYFQTPEGGPISEACEDLLRQTLQYDPERRISARQALAHEYIVDPCDTDIRVRYREPYVPLEECEEPTSLIAEEVAAVHSLLQTPPVNIKKPLLRPPSPDLLIESEDAGLSSAEMTSHSEYLSTKDEPFGLSLSGSSSAYRSGSCPLTVEYLDDPLAGSFQRSISNPETASEHMNVANLDLSGLTGGTAFLSHDFSG
jgi:serine/threonine protein kinase